jgi:uncharacterized protein
LTGDDFVTCDAQVSDLEDGSAVLDHLRTPSNAAALGIDTHKIFLAGHSMGGWVTAMTASKDSALAGAALISAADMGQTAGKREHLVAEMADEITANAKIFSIANAAPGLAKLPLLVITSDDGLAPQATALVTAIEAQGGKNVKTVHFAADHSYSDHRIALESAVLQWLADLK